MAKPVFSHPTVFDEPPTPTITRRAVTTTTTYTGAEMIVPVDATAGGFTLTLPLARIAKRGRTLIIVKANATNTVTVARQGADVIGYQGLSSIGLATIDTFLHLVSDGATRWLRF